MHYLLVLLICACHFMRFVRSFLIRRSFAPLIQVFFLSSIPNYRTSQLSQVFHFYIWTSFCFHVLPFSLRSISRVLLFSNDPSWYTDVRFTLSRYRKRQGSHQRPNNLDCTKPSALFIMFDEKHPLASGSSGEKESIYFITDRQNSYHFLEIFYVGKEISHLA